MRMLKEDAQIPGAGIWLKTSAAAALLKEHIATSLSGGYVIGPLIKVYYVILHLFSLNNLENHLCFLLYLMAVYTALYLLKYFAPLGSDALCVNIYSVSACVP